MNILRWIKKLDEEYRKRHLESFTKDFKDDQIKKHGKEAYKQMEKDSEKIFKGVDFRNILKENNSNASDTKLSIVSKQTVLFLVLILCIIIYIISRASS